MKTARAARSDSQPVEVERRAAPAPALAHNPRLPARRFETRQQFKSVAAFDDAEHRRRKDANSS